MAVESVLRIANILRVPLLRCIVVLGCLTIQDGFAQSPPNDDFGNATPLHGDLVVFSGNLTNSSFGPEEFLGPCYEILAIGTVWWRWTAEADTMVVIDRSPVSSTNAIPAVLDVFQGTNESELVHLDCTYLDSIPYRYVCFEGVAGKTYYIRAAGMAGEFTLRLQATNAPVIFASPKSQVATEGCSVVFSVFAAGAQPLSYQWFFAEELLTGQTKAVMLQHDLSTTRTGFVHVVVSNAKGSTASAVANLTVLPLGPLPRLEAVGVSETTNFQFSLSGFPEYYLIEASTNLIDWFGETSLFDYQLDGNVAVVPHFAEVTLVKITMESQSKFIRVRHYQSYDICVAQLSGINAAINLHGIHSKLPARYPVVYEDIRTYMEECKCPSRGRNLLDSYTIVDIRTRPYCQQVPQLHRLIP